MAELNVELLSVQVRKPDLLLQLEDGRILHIELQSQNDPSMAGRMFTYLALLMERFPGTAVLQIVVYFGQARVAMESRILSDGLDYRYQVIDIRDFQAEAFLNSSAPMDRVLAILCRDVDVRAITRRIVGSWAGEDENVRRDLAEMLVLASGLRRLNAAVEEELAMIREDEYLENSAITGWMDRGALRAQRSMLLDLSEERFGPLPEWAKDRVKVATNEDLTLWLRRLLQASSLDDLFREAER